MNDQQQTMLIQFAATTLGAILTQHGVITAAQSATLVNLLEAAAGPVILLATFIWGLLAHTQAAQRTAVAAQPEVAAIVTTPEVANSPEHKDNEAIISPDDAAEKFVKAK